MTWAAERSAVAAGKQAKAEKIPVLGWLGRAAVPGTTAVAGVVQLNTAVMGVVTTPPFVLPSCLCFPFFLLVRVIRYFN